MSAVQPKRKAAKVADLADARIMVLEELGPVRCLLLSELG